MRTHPPRAFPWEIKPPLGTRQGTGKHRRRARGRRARPRICLRKGCGRKYQPRCRHQRYCQDPECLREVRRWHAARRQGERRQDANVKTRLAQAEKARRQRAESSSQTVENPEFAPARGHAAQTFFSLPLCDRPGCYEHPASSPRYPARYCCRACRLAVRNVLDRDHKWLFRGTSDGRKKRAIEYEAARRRRILRQSRLSNPSPSRPPPG
jgi:hypothetical protein